MLEQKVKGTIEKYRLLNSGDRVVVAVSGGPDSVCLLHILYGLKDEYGLDLHVAHLNHLIRGEESELDALFVEDLALKLGLPFTVKAVDVPALQAELKVSLERAARQVRYKFLLEVAEKIKADKIAMGHTQDDKVGTIIMGFLRGVGLDGLVGIPPIRDNKIIRPLIELSRAEILKYCAGNGLEFRMDRSNLDTSILRNKIRLELLPILRDYSPNLKGHVLQLVEILSEDYLYLDHQADKLFEGVIVEHRAGKIIMDIDKLVGQSKALVRRVMRKALRLLGGESSEFGFYHIDGLSQLIGKPTGAGLDLPGGLVAKRVYNRLILGRGIVLAVPEPLSSVYKLSVPGITEIGNLRMEANLLDRCKVGKVEGNKLEAHLDYDRIRGNLFIRGWCAGDKFIPLGMSGRKKLQDLFVDLKVPRVWRQAVPIVVDEEKIVWVVGLRIDERVKVGLGTEKVLVLRVWGLDF